MQTYELIIIGAGLSGLSVINHLIAAKKWNKSTLLIDCRSDYQHDKSWCFWLPKNNYIRNQIEPLISKRWQNWNMDGVNKHTSNRPYCYVSSLDFYQHSLNNIHQNEWVELKLDAHIHTIQSSASSHKIVLSSGHIIAARYIIDTRPPNLNHAHSTLWQIFHGVEVQTTVPIFNDRHMHLMDELKSLKHGACFQYLLPFSPCHALIETTFIGHQKIPASELEPILIEYINKNFPIQQLNILRQEQGQLPMGLKINTPKSSNNYQYAGIVSGAIRPSSGYAFLRIQQQAYHFAQALSAYGALPNIKNESWLTRTMDNIFLKVCQQHPELIACFFSAFAQKVPDEYLVEFLSDECNVWNCLQVANALPKWLFIKSAFKYLGIRQNAYQ